MQDIKLGPFDGITAVLVIVACIIAAACLVAVFVVNIIKAIKEHFDDKEDKAEDEFFAEYGVTGEELRLNQKIAQKRNELMSLMHSRKARRASMAQKSEPDASPETQEPVEETPIEPAPVEEPIAPAAEPAPIEFAPKEEVKEEPKPEPISEPVKEEVKPEPIVEPAPVEPAPVEEPKKQGVAKPAAKKVVKKKPDDWSKYDGTYEGYYYDPEDACYYEGTPSPALAKKLAAKEAELEALNANKDKKVVIKKVAPPFAALKTPKNKRQAPKPVAGFDESVIYGKYVIEHVDKGDGTQEWFYTLYDASGNNIYESSNYTTQEYCERAINRFKSHAIIGTYTIEAADGKFFFVLKRKTYVHKGSPQNTFEDANSHMREIKNFAQTDIVRVQ